MQKFDTGYPGLRNGLSENFDGFSACEALAPCRCDAPRNRCADATSYGACWKSNALVIRATPELFEQTQAKRGTRS